MKLILFIAAAIFFALSAFRVGGPVDWNSAAFCCLTVGVLLI